MAKSIQSKPMDTLIAGGKAVPGIGSFVAPFDDLNKIWRGDPELEPLAHEVEARLLVQINVLLEQHQRSTEAGLEDISVLAHSHEVVIERLEQNQALITQAVADVSLNTGDKHCLS